MQAAFVPKAPYRGLRKGSGDQWGEGTVFPRAAAAGRGGGRRFGGPGPQTMPAAGCAGRRQSAVPAPAAPPAARALRLPLLLFPSEIQIRFDKEDRPQVEPANPQSQLYYLVCHHAVLQQYRIAYGKHIDP